MGYLASARGGYAYRYSRSRGGFFSSIGKALSTVGGIARNIPGVGGLIGGAAQIAGRVLQGGGGGGALTMPGGQPVLQLAPTARQSSRGVRATGVSPLGTVGVRFASSRRMNAGNAKAARRAIRRIKSVRKLLQSIERELPRRPARGSSRGVITAGEARRALRS